MILYFILVFLVVQTAVQAKVVTKTVPYRHNGVTLEGYLAYDDAIKGKRPGVLIVHEWWGLNDYARRRAEQLAAMGYLRLPGHVWKRKGDPTPEPGG